MKIWSFLIQRQRDFTKGALACWYNNFDAKLNKQTLLFCGQKRESNNLVSWTTGIPLISCSRCVGRGNCRSSNLQIWLSHRKLTNLCSSFVIRGPSIRIHSEPPGIQWSSQTRMVWPPPNIHFILCRSHCIPTWMAFQMWDILGFMTVLKMFVYRKYLAFNTWAHSTDVCCWSL